MAYAPPGESVPSTYGALGPPQGAASMLGQPRRYQPNATRVQKPTHVRVPVSTLIGLLLADAIKPVAAARSRPQRPGLPELANRVSRPVQQAGSLAALFGQPTPRTGPNRPPVSLY